MKKYLSVIPLVLLVCFVVGCQQKNEAVAGKPAVDIAAEEAAIREAFMTMSGSGASKDVDLFLSYCADDVIRAAATMQDKEGIRKFYTEWFAKGNYWDNESIDKIILSASGDLALVIYSSKRYWEVEGETKSATGTDDMAWKKQADGAWKIVVF